MTGVPCIQARTARCRRARAPAAAVTVDEAAGAGRPPTATTASSKWPVIAALVASCSATKAAANRSSVLAAASSMTRRQAWAVSSSPATAAAMARSWAATTAERGVTGGVGQDGQVGGERDPLVEVIGAAQRIQPSTQGKQRIAGRARRGDAGKGHGTCQQSRPHQPAVLVGRLERAQRRFHQGSGVGPQLGAFGGAVGERQRRPGEDVEPAMPAGHSCGLDQRWLASGIAGRQQRHRQVGEHLGLLAAVV